MAYLYFGQSHLALPQKLVTTNTRTLSAKNLLKTVDHLNLHIQLPDLVPGYDYGLRPVAALT